ncbi:hypothetical protein JL721_7446 [Aureococcus anophagefferens]|nr:hypothetical protein JL721_7446 [Aureococcus anophagefferens]
MPEPSQKVLVREPLLSVIDSGDVAGLARLVRNDPTLDLAQPYDDFRTPSLAHRALELGHTHLLRCMLATRPELALAPGLHGASLTHLAARRGNVDAVSLLLRYVGRAALDAPDQLGWSPLHDAAMEGQFAAAVVRAGGVGPFLAAEVPWVKLRWLAERRRAAPSLVYGPRWLALATFVVPDDAGGDDAKRRRHLPKDLLPLVLRYLY